MVSIKLPSYMLGEDDNVDLNDSSYGTILVQHGVSISDQLKKIQLSAPSIFSKIFHEGKKLKQNIVVIYNGELVKKNNIESIITRSEDEIEVIVQFAGG